MPVVTALRKVRLGAEVLWGRVSTSLLARAWPDPILARGIWVLSDVDCVALQATDSEFWAKPLYLRADERFLWNQHLLRPLAAVPEVRAGWLRCAGGGQCRQLYKSISLVVRCLPG